MTPSRDIGTLLRIMAQLRTPGSGCEWDLQQTFETIVPYTIEEAYEVADAVERRDPADLRDELGDLLLQVVYHARMAEEAGWFSFGDVVESISAKMIRRHPHVFGGEARGDEGGPAAWARIKAEEAEAKRARDGEEAGQPRSVLDGVARALPALVLAQKLSTRAAEAGFEWAHLGDVFAKLDEEVAELRAAAGGDDAEAEADEVGDVLFTAVNLARRLDVDAETALRGAVAKFERRFRHIERALEAQGRSTREAPLGEMEALWRAAKHEEADGADVAPQDRRRAPG